ncbi:hypothetical protein [Tissierella pigra]|uniref:Uncharacterized protein n=1 Tax=Tissierella pigra TaxID=2607614 RepID=A0A6N7Y032_9FIRM|nr:hypothetical protein [Tissierella pigra]MSU01410.1 hypothetical protein [Tissierella pigra]
MAKIVDLSVLVQEPLIFTLPNKEEFRIPGEVNTDFVLKMYKQQEELQKADGFEAQLKGLQSIVLTILQLDKSKNINLKYIQENLCDIRFLRVIMEEMMKHINEIQNDENL